jgi:hypothetical protein
LVSRASTKQKETLGKWAYVLAMLRELGARPTTFTIKRDDKRSHRKRGVRLWWQTPVRSWQIEVRARCYHGRRLARHLYSASLFPARCVSTDSKHVFGNIVKIALSRFIRRAASKS